MLCMCMLYVAIAEAQVMHVGLYRSSQPKTITVSGFSGHYTLRADSICIANIYPGDVLKIYPEKDSLVRVLSLTNDFGAYANISLTSSDTLSEVKIKTINPAGKEKAFLGDFLFRNEGGVLGIINEINIDEYIAAVVESESGYGHTKEYYKVQAIISRTYAISNSFKHVKDNGFNLCDNVHCQAYKSKGKLNATVLEAVRETHGIVMVDDSLDLVTAAFHSNCGGQTANSEQVWSKPLPYLRSVSDSYCTSQLNAYWKKEMPVSGWLWYMKKTYGINTDDAECKSCLTNVPLSGRKYGISCGGKTIPYKTIRTDLKLKSAYFSVSLLDSNTVLLQGRGFGHGVGLCQEGAMRMAKSGKTYKEILEHYFTNIHIVNLKDIYGLKEE